MDDSGGYSGPGEAALHRFADRLTGDAVVRGLIGPREAERIWPRHILNCAAVAPLFPADARVVDVGSGAGLPGIVLACVRADLRIDLVDSLHRRTAFLSEVVDELDLGDRVRVITGRVEEPAVVAAVGQTEWVTARAVAPLARLATWCLPLLAVGGRLAALKGERADDEALRDAAAVRRAHGEIDGVREFAVDGEPPTRVVLVRRVADRRASGSGRTRRSRSERAGAQHNGAPRAGRTRS